MENQEEKKVVVGESVPPVEKAPFFNKKILFFGLPIFVFQLVLVYFVTANIILSNTIQSGEITDPKIQQKLDGGILQPSGELGKHIFIIEDVIVNPSGTEGKRLLLTSLGFDLKNEASYAEIKQKEILIKDIIISTLSSKTIIQLDNSTYKDSLKLEIGKKCIERLPNVMLNSVYFSKYIIQ
jgi:flagellar protein FliL